MGSDPKDLEATTRKIVSFCKDDLTAAAHTGSFSAEGPLHAFLLMMARVLPLDTQSTESVNSLVAIQGRRAASISLELLSARMTLKYSLRAADRRWLTVKPRALRIQQECLACSSVFKDVVDVENRWTEPTRGSLPPGDVLSALPSLRVTPDRRWAASFCAWCRTADLKPASPLRSPCLIFEAKHERLYFFSMELHNGMSEWTQGQRVDGSSGMFTFKQPLEPMSTVALFATFYQRCRDGEVIDAFLTTLRFGVSGVQVDEPDTDDKPLQAISDHMCRLTPSGLQGGNAYLPKRKKQRRRSDVDGRADGGSATHEELALRLVESEVRGGCVDDLSDGSESDNGSNDDPELATTVLEPESRRAIRNATREDKLPNPKLVNAVAQRLATDSLAVCGRNDEELEADATALILQGHLLPGEVAAVAAADDDAPAANVDGLAEGSDVGPSLFYFAKLTSVKMLGVGAVGRITNLRSHWFRTC